jgi:hypothetical protein
MKDPAHWVAIAIVALGAAVAVHFLQRSGTEAPQPAPAAPEAIAPAKPHARPEPQIQHPLPQAAEAAPLPALEMSDTLLRETLAALAGKPAFEALYYPQNVVRRIVATVDNLPREKVALRLMPVRPAAGPMLLEGEGEARAIAAKNAARYRPYVALAESADSAKLVEAYVRLYPLFQQAYRELGYPDGYFNDRLVQVIDHLLAAPEMTAPVRVVQRKVLYEYADSDLEARSAGHKIMMRIGPENAARLKAKLRELRALLAKV